MAAHGVNQELTNIPFSNHPDTVYSGGWTALQIACEYGNSKTVRQLINSGCDINHRNTDGETALHTAASKCNSELVDILLSNGGDPNVQNDDGETALHIACVIGSLNFVRQLISNHCNVNQQDNRKRTALHYAVRAIQLDDVAECLLQAGADFDIIDSNGCSVLEIACGCNICYIFGNKGYLCYQKNVVRLLIEYGCDLSDIHRPLNAAVTNNTEVCELLLDACGKIIDCSSLLPHHNSREIQSIFDKHAIKLTAVRDSEEALCVLLKKLDFSGTDGFPSRCKDEVSQMKSFYIKDTTISLYNVLRADDNIIVGYMGNEEVVESSKETDFRDKFPVYGQMINFKLRRGLQRRLLFDTFVERFAVIFKDLPDTYIPLIFTFFTDKELRALFRTVTEIL